MMKRIRRAAIILLVLLLGFLIHAAGVAKDPPAADASLTSALQQALESSFSPFDVMGCSAVVLFADGELWQGVMGLSC